MILAAVHGHTADVAVTLVALLSLAALVAVVTDRIRVPYTVGLVLVGLILGVTGSLESIGLSGDLVFFVFLPVILFDAAYNLEARHLLAEWRPIVVLAVGGVLVAFSLAAVGLHFAGSTSWAVALLFGALIAATDPVSVVAVFRRLGVSERLTTIIEAESLFNDGVGAVIFAIVLAAVVGDGGPHVAAGLAAFVWMLCGGLAVGAGLGYVALRLHRLIDEHLVEITISAVLAYGSFLLGEELGMSGVVACVTAGVVAGNFGRHTDISPTTRVAMGAVWQYAAFLANSLVFLLVGLRIDLRTIGGELGLVLVAFAVALMGRGAAVYLYGLGSRLVGRRLPLSWQHVLVWGGLRGTIALVLVLRVPADVPGRDMLEVVTFGVVLLSLVGQGLTTPMLAGRLGLVTDAGRRIGREQRRVLLNCFLVAHEEVRRLRESGPVPSSVEGAIAAVERDEALLMEVITGTDDASNEDGEDDAGEV